MATKTTTQTKGSSRSSSNSRKKKSINLPPPAQRPVITEEEDSSSSSSSIRSILIEEFDAFEKEYNKELQQQQEEEEDTISGDAVAAGEGEGVDDTKQQYERAIRKRVHRILRKLNKAVVGSSGEDDDDTGADDESDETIVEVTLKRMIDCALIATSKSDSVVVIISGTISKNSSSNSIDNKDSNNMPTPTTPAYRALDLVTALLATAKATTQSNVVAHDTIINVLRHLTSYTTVLLERIRCAALFAIERYAGRHYVNLKKKNSNNNNNHNQQQGMNIILDLLSSAVIARITDKSVKVRQSAVTACAQVWAISNNDIDVLTSMVYAAQHDPSSTTRNLACRNLPLQELPSIEAWVSRVRDTSANVRVAACRRLALVAAPMWDPELRASIVQAGLVQQRRCVTTQHACLEIIRSWIRHNKYDPIELLKQLNVSHYETQALVVCKKLLEMAYSNNNKADDDGAASGDAASLQHGIQRAFKDVALVSPPPVGPETDNSNANTGDDVEVTAEALIWARAVCEYSQSQNDEEGNNRNNNNNDLIDQVVPDVPYLCQILEQHIQRLIQMAVATDDAEDNNDDDDNANNRRSAASSNVTSKMKEEDTLVCKCVQLLQLIPTNNNNASASLEEGSRRHLVQFLTSVLASITTPEDLIEPCTQVLIQSLSTSNDNDTVLLLDLLKGLRREQQHHNGLEENYWVRLLSILSVAGENPVVAPKLLLHGIDCVEETDDDDGNYTFSPKCIILEALDCQASETVRQLAVACLGQLGLWTTDKSIVAATWVPMLLATSEIRSQALLAMSDWAMIDYNILLATTADEDDDDDDDESDTAASTTTISFMELIGERLRGENLNDDDDDNTLDMCLAAEIAAKLIMQWHQQYPACLDWLPYLIAIFFDSTMQSDVEDHEEEQDLELLDVGSPARLQQLLSIFFPAFCLLTTAAKTEDDGGENENGPADITHAPTTRSLLESIGDVLTVMCCESNKSKSRKKKKKKTWPYAKMISYLCDTARQAQEQQQKSKSAAVEEPKEGEDSGNDSSDKNTKKADEIPVSLVANQVTRFLSQMPASVTIHRTLLKIVATLPLDEEEEEDVDSSNSNNELLLRKLREHIEDMELNCIDDDAACLQAMEQIRSMLPTKPRTPKKGGAGQAHDEADDDEETETEDDQSDDYGSAAAGRKGSASRSRRLSYRDSIGGTGSATTVDKENATNHLENDDDDDDFHPRLSSSPTTNKAAALASRSHSSAGLA